VSEDLRALLAGEVSKALDSLATKPSREAELRIAHGLKGSAGMVGEFEFAEALGRIEKRVKIGAADPGALVQLLHRAVAQLNQGQSVAAALPRWPKPPEDLQALQTSDPLHAQYRSETLDRIERLRTLVAAATGAPEARLTELKREALRHLHSVKGAASAMTDDAVRWYCHGLESQMEQAPSGQSLQLLGFHSQTLADLLLNPEPTLRKLRGEGSDQRFKSDHPSGEHVIELPKTNSIRVQSTAVDALLERSSALASALNSASPYERGVELASIVRGARLELENARRIIGPSRPWGVPASALQKLDAVEKALEGAARVAEVLHENGINLHRDVSEHMRTLATGLGKLRLAKVRELLDRVARLIEVEAREQGKQVRLLISGADEEIDRQLVEMLVDPCFHLARNAVTHGVASMAERSAKGKARVATISLSARRQGGRFILEIADDGDGLPFDLLRQRAQEMGYAEGNEPIDNAFIETLLMQEGLSSMQNASMSGGRGLGLGAAVSYVRRHGGYVRLFSNADGLRVQLDLPVERGLSQVLWTKSGTRSFALTLQSLGDVALFDSAQESHRRSYSLAQCIGIDDVASISKYVVHVLVGTRTVPIRVDDVLGHEQIMIRTLPSLLNAPGPRIGVARDGSGALAFVVDTEAAGLSAILLRGASQQGRLQAGPSPLPGRWAPE
jgi:chemotaxis protein histidine kinase CheA